FGYSKEEALGKPLTLLMPARYREAHKQGIARVRAGGPSRIIGRTVRMDGLRRSGEEFPVELSVSQWNVGSDLFFTGVVRDISRIRRAEEERDRLVALLEATPDFVGFADARTQRILYINSAGRTMCGIAADEDLSALRIPDVHTASSNRKLA